MCKELLEGKAKQPRTPTASSSSSLPKIKPTSFPYSEIPLEIVLQSILPRLPAKERRRLLFQDPSLLKFLTENEQCDYLTEEGGLCEKKKVFRLPVGTFDCTQYCVSNFPCQILADTFFRYPEPHLNFYLGSFDKAKIFNGFNIVSWSIIGRNMTAIDFRRSSTQKPQIRLVVDDQITPISEENVETICQSLRGPYSLRIQVETRPPRPDIYTEWQTPGFNLMPLTMCFTGYTFISPRYSSFECYRAFYLDPGWQVTAVPSGGLEFQGFIGKTGSEAETRKYH